MIQPCSASARSRLQAGLSVALIAGALSPALAQDVPPPGAEELAAPPAEMPPPEPAPAPEPVASPAPVAGGSALTDHQMMVGRWGLSTRTDFVGERSAGQDPACGTACGRALNALSVRRWVSNRYAWDLGLAIAAGGGANRLASGDTASWDTDLGIGPTVGASFLLANWKHMAVAARPELDVVFFMPSASGSKSIFFAARGVVEAELHLGFLGLPALTLGAQSGIEARFLSRTKGEAPAAGSVARAWSVGMVAPRSLWDLVTDVHVRYYF